MRHGRRGTGVGGGSGRADPDRARCRLPTAARRRDGSRSATLVHFLCLWLGLALVLPGCGGAGAQASRPTSTATHTPSMIYVALGASDAVGVGATHPETEGYVPRLIARLPADAASFNLGINGETVHKALAQELPGALAKHPTLVTVWLSANDFRDCVALADYATDFNTLLEKLQSGTRAQVFVANLPDMSLLPGMQPGSQGLGSCFETTTSAQTRTLTQQWNAAIAVSIAAHGDTLVDLFSSDLASHPEYISLDDGFHPSSAGYARLADLFWAQIQAHHAVPTG